MKIVIDISKEIYKKYMDDRTHVTDVLNAVRNGTPLPEHHGRLIDSKVLGNYFWDNRSKLFECKDLLIAIDNAPTIIEGSESE